jgi:Na+/melibiose symporter-like transporter
MGIVLTTILLTGLFILAVLILLAALLYNLEKLMHNDITHDDSKTVAQKQERFLQSSIMHVLNRAGR